MAYDIEAPSTLKCLFFLPPPSDPACSLEDTGGMVLAAQGPPAAYPQTADVFSVHRDRL